VRLVLDTNTAVSALLWHGNPGALVDAALAGEVELFSSAPLLAELKDVLLRPKFAHLLAARGMSAQELFEGYAALVTLVTPAAITPTVLRDPADDAVLACALAASADLVVSGDADLLDLKHFHGIDIANATDALARVRT
jgi:putative PIN family toxin of toxin-antitoxin system